MALYLVLNGRTSGRTVIEMIDKLAIRKALEDAFESAIKEVGIGCLKATSMSPLSRRKASEVSKAA